MVSPEPSESSPLFSRPPQSLQPSDPRNSTALSSFLRTPLYYLEKLQRLLPPVTLRTLFYATLAFIVFVNIGRKPPPYLSRPGPSVSMPRPIQSTGSNRTLSARILSLNTFIRPLLVGISDYKDERLARLEPMLRHYDVVCLQELFWTTGPRKNAFLQAIAKHGLLYEASSPVLGLPGLLRFPPKIIDAGLVIVSRYPIVKTDYHTFSRAAFRSIDIIVSKGVLYCRISLFADSPPRYAHVFTVHLQASNGLEDVHFDKIRASQIREISSFIQQMTEDDPDGVIIIAGDFNVDARAAYDDSSSSKEYNDALASLGTFRPGTALQDLLYIANNDTHPVTSAGGLKGMTQKNERLDYLFLSAEDPGTSGIPIGARAVPGSVQVDKLRTSPAASDAPYDTISDHYGVKAEIVFTETNG